MNLSEKKFFDFWPIWSLKVGTICFKFRNSSGLIFTKCQNFTLKPLKSLLNDVFRRFKPFWLLVELLGFLTLGTEF